MVINSINCFHLMGNFTVKFVCSINIYVSKWIGSLYQYKNHAFCVLKL